jgi:hypothetical protein
MGNPAICPVVIRRTAGEEPRKSGMVALVMRAQLASTAYLLLSSTLEKTLKENGYSSGSLASKIDAACADGVITESRKKKAHEEVRVLGNDVLHDPRASTTKKRRRGGFAPTRSSW